MKQVLWTPLAELELEEILLFIRAEGERPETARRIGEEIVDLVNQHAARESAGHKHPAAPPEWFYFQYKRWLIFYQAHPGGIEIMRIVDAVRDLPIVLRQNKS
jgi:plasmid stabilization system protein ParE